MTKHPQLDHVVLLLPYEHLTNLPAWVTDNFTVSEGGQSTRQHADGKTENKLILFRDGTYLELIAFVNDDPDKRQGHWWDKPFGVVDFALTNLDYDALTARLRQSNPPTNIAYAAPKAGGRITPSGAELKWEVTFPTGVERGAVPFWCEDVTPRARRVPVTEAATTHACGVLGMGGVDVAVGGERVQGLRGVMGRIVGVDGGVGEGEGVEVGTPRALDGVRAPRIRVREGEGGLALTLVLQSPNGGGGGGEGGKRKAIRERVGDGLISIAFE